MTDTPNEWTIIVRRPDPTQPDGSRELQVTLIAAEMSEQTPASQARSVAAAIETLVERLLDA
jgi:hypothetical protein